MHTLGCGIENKQKIFCVLSINIVTFKGQLLNVAVIVALFFTLGCLELTSYVVEFGSVNDRVLLYTIMN